MRKIFTVSFISLLIASPAVSATPWWQQPTVCRLDPTNCYASMGVGYDRELWDTNSDCWGMKLICPEALISTSENQPIPMGKADIAKSKNINQDFDTNKLNGDCFGVRKTISDGAMASVNGQYVKVWCNGVLNNPDEFLPNGEITFGEQPSCSELADYGYVAVVDNNCYGKYYDPSEYRIECDSDDVLPSRLVILNGADYSTTSGKFPADVSAANKIFDAMENVSENQRSKYYKN